MALALVVGCLLSFQTWYIYDLHEQINKLHKQLTSVTVQLTELRSDLCTYQAITLEINKRLNEAGQKPLVLPPPRECPPK